MAEIVTSNLDNDRELDDREIPQNKNAHIKISCAKCGNILIFRFQIGDLFSERVQALIDFIVSNHWSMNGSDGFVCDQPHGE
jgi:hypothetical protein